MNFKKSHVETLRDSRKIVTKVQNKLEVLVPISAQNFSSHIIFIKIKFNEARWKFLECLSVNHKIQYHNYSSKRINFKTLLLLVSIASVLTPLSCSSFFNLIPKFMFILLHHILCTKNVFNFITFSTELCACQSLVPSHSISKADLLRNDEFCSAKKSIKFLLGFSIHFKRDRKMFNVIPPCRVWKTKMFFHKTDEGGKV
jgi:hypothetical protein